MAINNREKSLHLFDIDFFVLLLFSLFFSLVLHFFLFVESIKCHVWGVLVSSAASSYWDRFIIFMMILGILIGAFLVLGRIVWDIFNYLILYFNLSFSFYWDRVHIPCNKYGRSCKELVMLLEILFEHIDGSWWWGRWGGAESKN